MERYSILRGTRLDSLDTTLGLSGQLPAFLAERNITDAGSAVDKINEFIRGFSTLKGYETISPLMKPVAVRYAPMHLYNLPGWASNIEKFCAIAVCGSENRVGSRNSTYALTTLFSHDYMLHTTEDGYCYLDQLFGGTLLNWQTVLEHTTLLENGDGSEEGTIDFEEIPQKVTPKRREADFRIAVRAAMAAVEEQNLVIVLEKDCDINKRAFELLAEIYSILPPPLAAETGYAVYQDPATIAKLTATTSIRYFLVPAEEADEKLSETGCLVIDLNTDKVKLGDSALRKAFETWWDMGWEESGPAMERCFDGVALAELLSKDVEKSVIVSRTEAYLNAKEELAAWRKNAAMAGTITTLEGLKAEYESHPDWKLLPNAADAFKRRVSTLTGKKKLSTLTEEMIAEVTLRREDGEVAEDDDPRYELIDFGTSFIKPDAERTAAKAADKQYKIDEKEKQQLREKHAAEIQQLREKHAAEIQQLREVHATEIAAKDAAFAAAAEAHAAEMTAEKERHAAEMQQLCDTHTAEIATKDAAFAAAAEKHSAEMTAEKQRSETEKQQLTAAHTEAMTTLRNEATEKLANAKTMLETEQAQHKADVEAEQAKHKADIEAERAQHKADVEAEQKRAAEEKQKLTADHAEEMAAEQKRAADEKQSLTEKFTGEKQALSTKLADTAASLTAVTTAKETAEKALETTKTDLDAAQERLNKAETEFKKIRERLQKTKEERDTALSERDAAATERDEVRAELDATPKDLRRAKDKIDDLQEELEKTPAFVRKAWWLPPVIALLVGALIVGVLWIILGSVSAKKNAALLDEAEKRADKAERTISELESNIKDLEAEREALIDSADAPQEESDEANAPEEGANEEPAEATSEAETEPEEATAPEKSILEDDYWSDSVSTAAFMERNPALQSGLFAEAAAEYVPEELKEACYALAVLSTDESIDGYCENYAVLLKETPADLSAQSTAPAADAEAQESDTTAADGNDAATEEVKSYYGADLVLTCGDRMLLVYGNDEMKAAALQAAVEIFVGEEPMEFLWVCGETDSETGEETESGFDFTAFFTEENGLRKVTEWCTDSEKLQSAQAELNTSRTPVMQIQLENGTCLVYDYRDDSEKQSQFMSMYSDSYRVTELDGFVFLFKALETEPDNATAPQN